MTNSGSRLESLFSKDGHGDHFVSLDKNNLIAHRYESTHKTSNAVSVARSITQPRGQYGASRPCRNAFALVLSVGFSVLAGATSC